LEIQSQAGGEDLLFGFGSGLGHWVGLHFWMNRWTCIVGAVYLRIPIVFRTDERFWAVFCGGAVGG
jgi:hypothetical protein